MCFHLISISSMSLCVTEEVTKSKIIRLALSTLYCRYNMISFITVRYNEIAHSPTRYESKSFVPLEPLENVVPQPPVDYSMYWMVFEE